MENLKAFLFIGAVLFSAGFIAANGAVMIDSKMDQEAAAKSAWTGRSYWGTGVLEEPTSTNAYSSCELGTPCTFAGTSGKNVDGLCRNTEKGATCVANLRR